MKTYEEFMIEYAGSDINGISPESVYNGYVTKVRPYISVISDYIVQDGVDETHITMALGISKRLWNACKMVFDEFKYVIESKESIAQLKADLLIVDGVEATEKKNPKMVEMYQHRFNPKYKPKKEDTEVVLPKTLNITFEDYSMSDDELEELLEEE